MKLACVIHRFGADIAGGSEAHCRVIAEHLAARHDVTIVTTCAKDHVSWADHYPPGESTAGPLKIRRFRVPRPRDLWRFKDISDRVFAGGATAEEQDQWFRENGPDSPELLAFLSEHAADFDLVLFWSYRYADAYFGVPLAGRRAVLVPTAEADPLIHISATGRLFAKASGFVFLTPEEVELLGTRVPADAPSCVIGCGLEAPPHVPDRSRVDALGLPGDYALYLGRVDPNKGCDTLFRFFRLYVDQGGRVPLVLAGPANMPIPEHPLIRPLGFVEEAAREALLQHARVLLMPSPYESLSMVLLEAWNHGVPALVNGRCDVLRGQTLRADGGLYYRNAAEFVEALRFLLDDEASARTLGAQGRAYVDREYRWPTVMARLEPCLEAVAARAGITP